MYGIRRIGIIALVAAAAPLAALAAHAQDAPDPPPAMHHGHEMGLGHEGPMGMHGGLERLKLTDDQKKRIEEIHFSHRKKAIAMRAEVESAHLDLERMMSADNPDQRGINAQIDRIAQLRANVQKDHVAAMFEMRSLLTPDQRKEWREIHRGMHEWGPGMRGPEGPGMMRHRMHGERMPEGPEGPEGPEAGLEMR